MNEKSKELTNPEKEECGETVWQEWLDDLTVQRDTLIMRLRQVEKVLVRYGRLKKETLPRRWR